MRKSGTASRLFSSHHKTGGTPLTAEAKCGDGDGDAPERRWIRDHRVSNGDDDIDGSSDHSATARGAVLKILLGVGLGFLLFTNQDARQITADLLRATGDAIAPADEDRTLEDRINEVLVGD